MSDLLRYISERYPLLVTIPLAVIIGWGASPNAHMNLSMYLIQMISIWLAFFALRALDDLHSIDEDRIKSPHRGLVTGVVSVISVQRAFFCSLTLLFIMNIGQILALAFITIVIIYYGTWYRMHFRIPYRFRPFGSNVIFACIPFYLVLSQHQDVTMAAPACAGFFYFSAIAHEYAHNIGVDKPAPLPSYEREMGARHTALTACLLFLLAFLCGIGLSVSWNYGTGLFVVLILHFILNQYYLIKWVMRPTFSIARRFYVLGYTFFLVPLCIRCIESLLLFR